MSLAPHDAELIEADAAYFYEEWRQPGALAWRELPEIGKEIFRRAVADPYNHIGKPAK